MTNQTASINALLVGAALVAATLTGCGGDTSSSTPTTTEPSATTTSARDGKAPSTATPVIDPGDGGKYAPAIDPARFVERIDNPYLPLLPGARWVFEGESEGKPERVEVSVLADRRDVMGISSVVVRDTVYVAGEVVEDTYDWFAQDVDGNVWYLGEDVRDYVDGKVVSTAGSWEAGIDGALPGIVMPDTMAAGDAYRQEFLAGEAEDMFEVISTGGSRKVTSGSYDQVVVTEEWTPLEPEVVESKYYAPGVGQIFSEAVSGEHGFIELVEFSPGA